MKGQLSLLLFIATFMGGSVANAADKVVTFWSTSAIDVGEDKLVPVKKLPGKAKLGKACAGNAGKFDHWSAVAASPADTFTPFVTIISKESMKGSGARLYSIRPEGECKEGKLTYRKYSALLEQQKPNAVIQPASAATPTPAPKKKDDKKPK